MAMYFMSSAIIFSSLSWLDDFGPTTTGNVANGESFPLFFKNIVMVNTQMLPDFDALLDFDVSQSSFHSTNDSGKWGEPKVPVSVGRIDCRIAFAIWTPRGVSLAYWYVPLNEHLLKRRGLFPDARKCLMQSLGRT